MAKDSQHFLQQTEGAESFNDIAIIRGDNDLQEFQAKKQRVLDDVLQNVEERCAYRENDPVLKAAAVLDPDIWPEDPLELSSYGDAEIVVLVDYYKDHLSRAGCELTQIVIEWSLMKSHVSLHLSSRRTEEVFSSIFRSLVDAPCRNSSYLAIVNSCGGEGLQQHEQGEEPDAVKHEPRKHGWCAQNSSQVSPNPKRPKAPCICQLWPPFQNCHQVPYTKHQTSERTVG